jgi:hypothetical protein
VLLEMQQLASSKVQNHSVESTLLVGNSGMWLTFSSDGLFSQRSLWQLAKQ